MRAAIMGRRGREWAAIVGGRVQAIRTPERAAGMRWTLLALTHDGAEALRGRTVQCETLLLPGDADFPVCTAQVISYGMSPRDSLTLSGEGLLCVQRRLIGVCGRTIEPQEIRIDAALRRLPAEQALLVTGMRLLLEKP